MSVYLDLDITLKSNIIYNYRDNYIYRVIYHNSGDHITFIIIKSTGSIGIYKDYFNNLMNNQNNYPVKKYITLDHLNKSMYKNIYRDENIKKLVENKNIIVDLEDNRQEYINIPMNMINQEPSEIRLNSYFQDLYQDYLYLKNHECDFYFKKYILDVGLFIILGLVYISIFLILVGVFLSLVYIGHSI